MKGRLIAMIAVVLGLFAASFALAATGEDAAVDPDYVNSDSYTASPATPGDVLAQQGNVTNVDVESNASTSKWQGFYGNVSGNVYLGMGSTVMYDFGSADVTAVYASQNQSFDFSSIDEGVAAEVDTSFGFTGSDPDSAASTYTGTMNIDGLVGAPSTVFEDGNFGTYVADDSAAARTDPSYYAFGANVSMSGMAGFDTNMWQYELMVPMDAATDTYYFFMTV